MNELDFSFGDSPWEQLLSYRQPGESVSAAHLLALLEEEEEQAVEDAFQDLESMEIGLDVSDLPRVKAAGEATARLLREMELSKDGITPDQWEPDDPLRMYLEELAATPVYGEEGLLAVQAAQGDEQAKQNLACMGLSRVLEIAREFTGFGVLLLDLIQEGSLGLWQAVNRCDGSNYKNIRDFWIRFYMAKAVTLQARANGVGQKARRGLEDYKQVDERLLGELGRNPTLEEIAEQLHMELEEAESLRKMLDDAEELADKAKTAIKAALADESNPYHEVTTFFMCFHRDDVGEEIAHDLFPGIELGKLTFPAMVDLLQLKRFGSLTDGEGENAQQAFILDLSFNPKITDELMVIYFDVNKEIFCITHES